MSLGGELVTLFEGMDAVAVGDSLGEGMRQMTKVVVSLAGVEAYDAWRGFRADRESMATGHSSVGSVLAHLGIALMKGAVKVGTSIVGMSMGAAIGTALFPGAGSTVGAIIGAAGLTIVGNIVYRKLTTDLPVFYRLGRIRRMMDRLNESDSSDFKQFLVAKIQKQEIKLLKRFSLEMRKDRFDFLDEILQQVRKEPMERRKYWQGVREKIEAKLKFEVLNRGDKLFAWKLDQVREAFGDPPLAR
jgi:hypothetical protein